MDAKTKGELDTLIAEGQHIVNQWEDERKKKEYEELCKIFAQFDEIFNKHVIEKIPKRLQHYILIKNEDARSLVLKGFTQGITLNIDGLLPVYLFIDNRGTETTLEYIVPGIIDEAEESQPGKISDIHNARNDDDMAFHTEDLRIALYYAALRHDKLVEMQKENEAAEKEQEYVPVETSQATEVTIDDILIQKIRMLIKEEQNG